VDEDVLAIAQSRRSRGESVTAIARRLSIGRSTLYRALQDSGTDDGIDDGIEQLTVHLPPQAPASRRVVV
jgi:DNA invertase Pin-like site-specific DNA recombinase